MYKLYRFLFGWDYVAWSNSADDGIARVHRSDDGKCWYFRYKITKCIDVITQPDQVLWLTCESGKYLYYEKPYKTVNDSNVVYIQRNND